MGMGLRAVNRAAVPPQWRPDRAYAGASCAFLFPQFLTRAGDQLFVLGGMRAGALCRPVMLYRFPEQIFVDSAENFVGQLQRADLRAGQI